MAWDHMQPTPLDTNRYSPSATVQSLEKLVRRPSGPTYNSSVAAPTVYKKINGATRTPRGAVHVSGFLLSLLLLPCGSVARFVLIVGRPPFHPSIHPHPLFFLPLPVSGPCNKLHNKGPFASTPQLGVDRWHGCTWNKKVPYPPYHPTTLPPPLSPCLFWWTRRHARKCAHNNVP